MRSVALIWLFLASGASVAAPLGESLYPGLMEFEEAFGLYSDGEFERARTGFHYLAEMGDPEGRLNLGVMLVKGEGGPVDRIEGAAWIRWAEEGGIDHAADIRGIIERGLDPVELAAVASRLEGLKVAGGAEAETPDVPSTDAADTTVSEPTQPADDSDGFACMKRSSPNYPEGALWKSRPGVVVLDAMVDPDGILGAVQAMNRTDMDEFAREAVRAMTSWHAGDCPPKTHTRVAQTIEFAINDFDADYTEASRVYAAELLADAREGDPAAAFGVATLAQDYTGLFELMPGEVDGLLQFAAVAGLPEARYMMDQHWMRWVILAARQGYGPALYQLYRSERLSVDERRRALREAARTGHKSAIFMAARWFAAHPEAAERDGLFALEVTSESETARRQGDVLIPQARAMALAETGQFIEAARLQDRIVRTLRRSSRPVRLAEERLVAYRAGKAWRDPTLLKESAPRVR